MPSKRYRVVGRLPVFGVAPGGELERDLSPVEQLLVGRALAELEPAAEPTPETKKKRPRRAKPAG